MMRDSSADFQRTTSRLLVIALGGAFAVALTHILLSELKNSRQTTIGEVVDVTEVSTGLTFKGRVDTGAAISSIHCEQIEIENESDDPRNNLDKTARVMLVDENGNRKWVTTRLVGYAKFRNVDASRFRYCALLTLSCQGVVKETPVSLRDRGHMEYRLLVGREFLVGDFVVDVARGTSVLP